VTTATAKHYSAETGSATACWASAPEQGRKVSAGLMPEGLLWIRCCLRVVASLEVVHAFGEFVPLEIRVPGISFDSF